jgi:hypothetical protein
MKVSMCTYCHACVVSSVVSHMFVRYILACTWLLPGFLFSQSRVHVMLTLCVDTVSFQIVSPFNVYGCSRNRGAPSSCHHLFLSVHVVHACWCRAIPFFALC